MNRSLQVTVVAAAIAAATTALASCAVPVDGHGGEIVPFAIDDSQLVLTAYEFVLPGDCLGRPVEIEGLVPLANCELSGTAPIVSVEVLGDNASGDGSDAEVTALAAFSTCAPLVATWAEEVGRPSTLAVPAMLISETWEGPNTRVVCATLPIE